MESLAFRSNSTNHFRRGGREARGLIVGPLPRPLSAGFPLPSRPSHRTPKGHATVPCRQNEVTHTRYQTWSNQGSLSLFLTFCHSLPPPRPHTPSSAYPCPPLPPKNPLPQEWSESAEPNRRALPPPPPSGFCRFEMQCSLTILIVAEKLVRPPFWPTLSIYRGMDATTLLGKEERRF